MAQKQELKKAAIGPIKGVSQENQDQILVLKYLGDISPNRERQRVCKFCITDIASVFLNNSKSKDKEKKMKH